MALKTFSIESDVYTRFSEVCKENGLNMSRQVEMFMQGMINEEPKISGEYQKRLDRIMKGRFVKVSNFPERYK